MNKSEFDQTLFSQDLGNLDAGGELNEDSNQQTSSNSKKKLIFFLGLVLSIFLLFFLTILWLITRRSSPQTLQIEEVVTQSEVALGPLERQLLLLERDIEKADPFQTALAFPPVDFQLNLEDATIIQLGER